MKLASFTSHPCNDGKEMYTAPRHVQSSCFTICCVCFRCRRRYCCLSSLLLRMGEGYFYYITLTLIQVNLICITGKYIYIFAKDNILEQEVQTMKRPALSRTLKSSRQIHQSHKISRISCSEMLNKQSLFTSQSHFRYTV